MSEIKKLLPDLDQRVMLRSLIEFEYTRCFDSTYRLHAIVTDDGNYDDINNMLAYYSHKMEQLADIYFRLFAENLGGRFK